MLDNLYKKYRYSLILLRELVITEFKLRYQGSVLGYLWSLLKPLFMFVILYVVFVYFFKIGDGIPHWPVALLFGIVLWNFFSEITSNGINAIVSRGDIIRKINFPKYVIILASSISALINLILNFIIIVIFMLINGVEFQWSSLGVFIYVFELLIFGVGLAFIFSTLFVKFRDINYIWEIVSQALFYGSIVMYPVELVIDKSLALAHLLLINPIAQSIQGARHSLISDVYPTLNTLTDNIWIQLVPFVIVVATFVLGTWYFKRRSPYFAEEI